MVGISGYSSLAPSSQSKMGQQSGKLAVLLVFSESLHLGLGFGNGPQSSTSSNKRPELSSAGTQVERPQNGESSQDFVGSIVAHLVEAKHIPGKSKNPENTFLFHKLLTRENLNYVQFLSKISLIQRSYTEILQNNSQSILRFQK